jgi:nucleoside-diphosphate-sugar epimerase
MRIAVLGARGFLGRRLSEVLLSQGHDITGYVLDIESAKDANFECKSIVELFETSIAYVPPFDVTINLAARRSTSARPFTDAQVREFTFEIPRAFFLKTAGPQTLVLNSSTYIQNFEGLSGKTVDSYGAAKEKLSRFLETESASGRFTAIDLFFFTVYGPGDRPEHLVPLLLNSAKTGQPISLSPGHQLMNLLYVEDLLKNLLTIMYEPRIATFQKYHVWSSEYFSVRELVARIEPTIKKEINCSWGARAYVGHEMMEPWAIPMQQVPGFAATTSLEEGITRTWNSILRD